MEPLILAQIKSTLDARVKALADSLGVQFHEADDSAATAEEHQSARDAIVWQLSDIQIDRNLSFYTVRFSAGAKTADDVGNTRLMTYLNSVAGHFSEGDTIYIRDYTTPAAPTQDLGFGVLTSSRMGSQQFDRQANYRMIDLAMRVVEY